jgi:outer membrane lipoprotein carrier protein
MITVFRFLSLMFLLLLLLPESGLAEDTTLDALIMRFQETYEGVSDLTAAFEQETRLQDFKTEIKSNGTLYLKKKGKMKLAYDQPKKEIILINGTEILTYLPEQHQVIKGVFSKEQESRLPVRLLSGETLLKKEFQIQWAPDRSQKQILLQLTPLLKESPLEQIELEFDPVTFLIRNLKLDQANQNSSFFRFSKVRVNRGIKDNFFNFSPPEGTEILEGVGSSK